MGIAQTLCGRRDGSYRGDFETVAVPRVCGTPDCTAAVYRNWDRGTLHSMVRCAAHQDDGGEWHYHDRNDYMEHWYCYHQHAFTRRVYKICWCGWTQRPKDDVAVVTSSPSLATPPSDLSTSTSVASTTITPSSAAPPAEITATTIAPSDLPLAPSNVASTNV